MLGLLETGAELNNQDTFYIKLFTLECKYYGNTTLINHVEVNQTLVSPLPDLELVSRGPLSVHYFLKGRICWSAGKVWL